MAENPPHMKKFFRFLGILILLLLAVFLITALVAPKDITMERTAMMKAPKELVFEQMVKFRNWPKWSPWVEMEPDVAITYNGTDGEPGSSYVWKGKKTGEGEMKNAGVTGTQMNYDLMFKEPFESHATGFLKAEDAGNGETRATWTFNTHVGFPWNGMMAIMGMLTGGVGKDFDKGLANMKAYVESGKATMASTFTIQDVQFEEHTYATIRKTISWSEMHDFFGKSYDSLGKAAGPRISGAPVGIYYKWDTEKQQADVAAGFPVSGSEAVKGAGMITVPASNAYMVAYKGAYSGSGKAHDALGKHVADAGKTQGPVIEEYVVSPAQEADSNKWVTNIYYLYK